MIGKMWRCILKYETAFAAGIHESKGQEKDTGGIFLLHPPLGMTWEDYAGEEKQERSADPSTAVVGTPDEVPETLEHAANESEKAKPAPSIPSVSKDFDCLRTGKTGVAFGLLRTRIGGRDVKIIDEDAEGKEIPFRYFLGNIDRDNHFHVRIGMKVPYGQWVWFAYADDAEFELYYTKEPNSLNGEFTESDVDRVRCRFDAADCSEDDEVGVYIRKVKPDTIEYAVGRAEDFASGDFQGKKYTKQLR